jgi:hypothetical protein
LTESTTRYVAFDIETAKEVPGDDFVWRPHRPLGISCAATWASDADQPVLWHGKRPDGSPSPKMSRDEALELARYLAQMTESGYTVLTWNGLSFDFDILAEESGDFGLCKKCALGHVDMMFHLLCLLGYPVGLGKAAQGMGVEGKPAGMSGEKAPRLWAAGHYQQVLDYVAQDVRIALDVALAVQRRHQFAWINRKGTRRCEPMPSGWLSVERALRLPLPDTSWMTSPISRSESLAWMSGK